MRDLDDTDTEILRLLVADGRLPYSTIAEQVDLSPPAVRDRIDRLREIGVIQRFTVDLDRSKLRRGLQVLIDLHLAPSAVDTARAALLEAAWVEHVFVTADSRIVVVAHIADGDVREALAGTIDLDAVHGYEVSLLADIGWSPGVEGATLAVACAECGNTVTAEGESAQFGGRRYDFCCPSCLERFEARYESLESGASF